MVHIFFVYLHSKVSLSCYQYQFCFVLFFHIYAHFACLDLIKQVSGNFSNALFHVFRNNIKEVLLFPAMRPEEKVGGSATATTTAAAAVPEETAEGWLDGTYLKVVASLHEKIVFFIWIYWHFCSSYWASLDCEWSDGSKAGFIFFVG